MLEIKCAQSRPGVSLWVYCPEDRSVRWRLWWACSGLTELTQLEPRFSGDPCTVLGVWELQEACAQDLQALEYVSETAAVCAHGADSEGWHWASFSGNSCLEWHPSSSRVLSLSSPDPQARVCSDPWQRTSAPAARQQNHPSGSWGRRWPWSFLLGSSSSSHFPLTLALPHLCISVPVTRLPDSGAPPQTDQQQPMYTI